MKLKNKLLLSQVFAFIVIFIILLIMVPQIIYSSTQDKEIRSALSFNEQIMMRMEKSFDELERFSYVVSEDDELSELLQSYVRNPSTQNEAKIRIFLSNMGRNDGIPSYQVLGIALNIEHGMQQYSFHTVGLANSIQSMISEKVLPGKEKNQKTKTFIEPFEFPEGESTTVFGGRFSQGYGYVQSYKKNGIVGDISIIASFDEIIYIAQDITDYCKDFQLLMGDSNTVVDSSVKTSKINIEEVQEELRYGNSYLEGYTKNGDEVTMVRYSKNGGWKLFTRLTREEILSNNRSLIILNDVLVALFGILIILIMIPIVKKFVGPLSEVSHQMGEVAKGNLEAKISVRAKDEIGEVIEAFNIMTEKLDDNVKELIVREQTEQKLRYGLLVSQVDPHFIYNTMNTISYLAQKGRNQDVIAVNKAMIEILRDRLRIEISEVYDTVEQEISVTKQYLLIQDYRYEGIFKTKITIEDMAKSHLIAKNIIQPLVENALYHGILENRDENGEVLGGLIEIAVTEQERQVKIVVKDNGARMSQEQVDKILNQPHTNIRGEHIGIRNIRERVSYIYKESAKLNITSREGYGTIVCIKVPIV